MNKKTKLINEKPFMTMLKCTSSQCELQTFSWGKTHPLDAELACATFGGTLLPSVPIVTVSRNDHWTEIVH